MTTEHNEPISCSRCGARYRQDPSCGKVIHAMLPDRPAPETPQGKTLTRLMVACAEMSEERPQHEFEENFEVARQALLDLGLTKDEMERVWAEFARSGE